MVVPLLWGLLGALAVVLSRATSTPIFAWVGYLMLALLIFGEAAARLGARGLVASRELSADRVAFGGQVTVKVEVENRSRLPVLWVAAAESLAAGLPMRGVRGRLGPMGARSKWTFSCLLQATRRGFYEIGPTVLRTGDLFGLGQRQLLAGATSALTVFPKIVSIHHARLPSRRPAPEVRVRQRVLEDPTQVVGVRPYQHGDGLRRVHWRATAHTGRLQSKLFEVSAQVAATIVLNLRREDYPGPPAEADEAAELGIMCAASLATHLLDRRQPTGLLCLGRDPAGDPTEIIRRPVGRGREQLTALLSLLGRAELGPAKELGPVLRREQERFPWGSLVIVITPGVSETVLPSLLRLRTAGLEVHVISLARAAGPAREAALEAIGIPATRIRAEEDIRGLGL